MVNYKRSLWFCNSILIEKFYSFVTKCLLRLNEWLRRDYFLQSISTFYHIINKLKKIRKSNKHFVISRILRIRETPTKL